MLAALINKATKNDFAANFYTLVVLMTLCVAILTTNSVQMCFQVEFPPFSDLFTVVKAENAGDVVNSYVFICLFALVKTWNYGCPHLFIFTFYPIEQYSFIYAVLTIPTIGFQWVVNPLYRKSSKRIMKVLHQKY